MLVGDRIDLEIDALSVRDSLVPYICAAIYIARGRVREFLPLSPLLNL